MKILFSSAVHCIAIQYSSHCDCVLFIPVDSCMSRLFHYCPSLVDTASELLAFFLTLFASLKAQVGLAFAQRTSQTFMALFSE